MDNARDFLAARRALILVGADRALQERIMEEIARRLDRQDAVARRNYWLKIAHRLVGYVSVLSAALHDYETRIWPCMRHLPEPPTTETPLRKAFFRICEAAEDAGTDIPGERQLRRLVT